jgi:polysaccharide biosynthesis transport protein
LPVPAPEPRGIDEALEIRRLVWVLFERKWQILLVAALVVTAAAVRTFQAESLYLASAMVQIEPEPVQVLPYRDVDLPRYAQNYEVFMRTQEQVLRGSRIISRIAERLKTEPDADNLVPEIPQLSGRLSIQRLPDTQMMLLSYVSPQPELSARVANVYAEEYIKLHFENRQQTRENARRLLERELEALEQRVQQSEKELVSYAQEHGIPLATTNEGLVQQKLTMLGAQLADVDGQVFAAQSRLGALRRATIAEFPERLTTPAISGLMSRQNQLENDLTVLRMRFGENWPAVAQKRTEIALAQEQLDREKSAALAQALEQATVDYQALENRRRLISSSLAEQQELMNQLETASIQYNIIRREVDTNRRMYEGLLERLKQTSVTTGMELGGFQVIEPARPSYRRDSPRPRRDLALAGILGLALGVCLAFVLNFWDTSLSTIEEVEQSTLLPVLGAVPHLPSLAPSHPLLPPTRKAVSGNGNGHLVISGGDEEVSGSPHPTGLASDAAAAEGVRNICASILLSRSGRPPRVLMVTSAVAGEGKTTLAQALGEAFADHGARTLLIECDMRRPSFGKVFNVGSEGGLSLYLSGHGGPAPAIHSTANGGLFVIAAGPPPPNPPALLTSDKLKSFIEDMTSSFQFIILDAPPTLPVADARVIAPMTEGVVLVVRAGLASKHVARRARVLLENIGANVLGAVLNAAAPRNAASHYSHYETYYQRS